MSIDMPHNRKLRVEYPSGRPLAVIELTNGFCSGLFGQRYSIDSVGTAPMYIEGPMYWVRCCSDSIYDVGLQ